MNLNSFFTFNSGSQSVTVWSLSSKIFAEQDRPLSAWAIGTLAANMPLVEIVRGDGSLAMGLKHLTLVFPVVILFYIYNYQLNSMTVGPVIRISTGLIQGFSGVSRDGLEFYEFLGIPYAQAPVGNLRFEPPQPPLNWEGTRSANAYGPSCTQVEFFTQKLLGEEDCLFLNVFVPKKDIGVPLVRLPVMVYFHGGYFMSGSGNAYRPEYLMDANVVLVTINYRTAAFGFLNTGDEVVRGNMGLKDQVKSLLWIQTNIAKFGGDPNRVTLFGNSAGAASVHYHVLSPMSKGLFHKAISESGTAIKVWSFVSRPAEQAVRLGKKLNCPTVNSTVLISCLKKLDANIIAETHWEYLNVFLDPLAIYAPSIESVQDQNTFLSKHPYEILTNGDENKVPWICGLNSDEGLLFSSRIIKNENLIKETTTRWNEVAPALLGYSDNPKRVEINEKVLRFYFGDKLEINFRENFQNFTNMLSDRLYFSASKQAALLQSRYSPVYAYYYTYKAQFSFASLLQLSGRLPAIAELGIDYVISWIRRNIFRTSAPSLGICHGDELVMLFNLRFLSNIKEGHQDYDMSKSIVKLWTDFARAEPNESLEFRGTKWLPAQPSSPLKFLNLDSESKIIDEPFTERLDFWNSLGLGP